jgi:hypothetical protein
VDIAVWLQEHERIAELLAADGWKHAPEEDEDGGTGYERGGVRLELTFLVRDDEGHVVDWSAGRTMRLERPPGNWKACVRR